jgi:N-acetylmuramoyl-L-alanine amidase
MMSKGVRAMKNRLWEKFVAVVCASGLAIGVMSGVVFAREEEPDPREVSEPQATFVILDEASDEVGASAYEVVDNRTTVPLYVDEAQQGLCSLVEGVPYVSVAGFCQALGLEAQPSIRGDTLTLQTEGVSLTATAGQIYFVCNGRYLYVETGVLSQEGDILLPVEALVKCLGVSVSWDQITWRITVTATDISPLESGDTFYDETDVYWLSRVIYAEAGNQPLLGQIAVGDVVMNRMKDPAFASQDSVYDVIFAKNQFEVVINGMIYMTPDEQSQVAAKIALEGVDVVSGATYFATYELGAGYECVTWIGAHCFMTAA